MSSATHPLKLPFYSLFSRFAERVTSLHKLIKLYDSRPQGCSGEELLEHCMDYLNCKTNPENATDLPKSGPLIIVANHPLGGLEGIVLTKQLIKKRPDIKVLTNEVLLRIPEFKDLFIPVNVFSKNAALENAKNIRLASQHLKNNGALLIFPAGRVSRLNFKNKRIQDRAWNPLVGMLQKRYKAQCLPIYIKSNNSKLFYLLSLLHPLLGTLMLPRELANKCNKTLDVVYGDIIQATEFNKLKDSQTITDYLRINTEVLDQKSNNLISTTPFEKIIDTPTDVATIAQINKISQYKLIEKEEFAAYCVPYADMGPIMNSIGIAREVTFRAVGEGTGKEIDLDRFDPYYWHLFIWDNLQNKIVGSYRVGHVTDIINNEGIKGLYSRSLYKYKQSYLKNIDHALEVGRSFIHPDYQRLPLSMDLLWRGIGHYVAKNPQYHTLFGAVSISREHSDVARSLMADSLVNYFGVDGRHVNKKIKPLIPIKNRRKLWNKTLLASLNSISLLNKVVGRCDPGKAVPVLLRHYLSLNGKLACFTVNKGFNDSLDGLIIVNLRDTPPKYVKRYLGKDGAKKFAKQWQLDWAEK